MRKLVAYIATVALVVLGLMFSALLFAIIVIAGLTAWGYIWWKTRALRRLMREQADANTVHVPDEFGEEAFKGEVFKGEIIEGEVTCRVVTRDAVESR
jgi:hypothetical protein